MCNQHHTTPTRKGNFTQKFSQVPGIFPISSCILIIDVLFIYSFRFVFNRKKFSGVLCEKTNTCCVNNVTVVVKMSYYISSYVNISITALLSDLWIYRAWIFQAKDSSISSSLKSVILYTPSRHGVWVIIPNFDLYYLYQLKKIFSPVNKNR